MSVDIAAYISQLHLPSDESHKGQNGKVMIIGGSELFHAASKWSLDMASKFVDMVFYSSVPSNNALIKEAKGEFWNGIVIERSDVENYLSEADVVLIGPGMDRSRDTEDITNQLVTKYLDKKWVIDAGALQMIDHHLLNQQHIITPHKGEFKQLWEKVTGTYEEDDVPTQVQTLAARLHHCTILYKSHSDVVSNGHEVEVITGGNGGMTKGGTGDALAGLVAGLYCKEEAFVAAVLGSYTNKKAGDALYIEVGPFFNASDLVEQVPKTLWQLKQGKI